MHRLFVAVRPPVAIRSLLLAAMGGVSGARWQSDDQLHVTLRFIGEVDRHQASDIHAALGAVHQASFEIAVSGLGTFDRRGQPEVIWAGLAPHAPLAALHKKIDQALTRVGVEPDRRAFHPHVTLARLKRTSGPVDNLIGGAGGLSSPPFLIDALALYESRLTPEGAVYSAIERYPLG